MSMTAQITALYHYPIKSFAGIAVERLAFDSAGPVDDRRWMLVNAKGRFVSQRDMPELANFGVQSQGDGYRITAPDGDYRNLIRGVASTAPITVTVWKDDLDGWEVSSELSAWFSDKLGKAVRLVYLGTESERRVPDAAALDHERVGFADGYPLLLCNQSSLEGLNERAGVELDVRRFRPNLVVSGLPMDQELELGRLTLADGHLQLLKPCERCSIPAVDPDTGVYQRAVATALKEHSRFNGKTIFGMNAVARGVSELRVGDSAQLASAD
ncbi:MOSC domain-containing protein [Saccharospirillum sp. MSK14-1]|uniref:MOSC domain-containing protein n=1 Tax=Saccharospirillum sp. MSK14-1 TaxID=1897632 RepID=UPI0013048A8E|nr:MOSC N-terminal beta barrel domain-containing protein [Saccharospirillum sp. MSK14-1]